MFPSNLTMSQNKVLESYRSMKNNMKKVKFTIWHLIKNYQASKQKKIDNNQDNSPIISCNKT